MSEARLYLDYTATAPLRPEARDAMVAALGEVGNASSVHAEGTGGAARIEQARDAVAGLVGGDAKLVTFISGGTEANNTVSPRTGAWGASRIAPISSCVRRSSMPRCWRARFRPGKGPIHTGRR